MNETTITIILCVIASTLAVIVCNLNRCKYWFKYSCQKKSQGITIDEMKIIIDDMDEIDNLNKNENKEKKKNNDDKNELL